MVAYSFQGRFVGAIQAGTKTQTIRAHRKRRHVRPGERIQLYAGMRTKACRKIRPDVVCLRVVPIILHRNGGGYNRIQIDGVALPRREHDTFAKADGFQSAKDMACFWRDTHASRVFHGVLIEWGLDDGADELDNAEAEQ